MSIQAVIALLNRMEADGVVRRYAIGGAVGATFYVEPVATLDVGVFVVFQSQPGALLVSLQPLYEYLGERGGTIDGESVVMEGWPVQFLRPPTPLVEEVLLRHGLADSWAGFQKQFMDDTR